MSPTPKPSPVFCLRCSLPPVTRVFTAQDTRWLSAPELMAVCVISFFLRVSLVLCFAPVPPCSSSKLFSHVYFVSFAFYNVSFAFYKASDGNYVQGLIVWILDEVCYVLGCDRTTVSLQPWLFPSSWLRGPGPSGAGSAPAGMRRLPGATCCCLPSPLTCLLQA